MGNFDLNHDGYPEVLITSAYSLSDQVAHHLYDSRTGLLRPLYESASEVDALNHVCIIGDTDGLGSPISTRWRKGWTKGGVGKNVVLQI